MKAAVLVASILPWPGQRGGGAEEPTACFVLAGAAFLSWKLATLWLVAQSGFPTSET